MTSPDLIQTWTPLRASAGSWSVGLISPNEPDRYGAFDIDQFARFIESVRSRDLVFLLCDTSVRTVSRFVQILGAHLPVALIDAGLGDDQLAGLLRAYRPGLVVVPHGWSGSVAGLGYGPGSTPGVWVGAQPSPVPVHEDLAVLLTTSGSTGSPKFVRLSRTNIETNAAQIARSLHIGPDDRAATALPLHYSFGMSVVTSHALAGATVVVTGDSVMSARFWEAMRAGQVSFLPGVPSSLAMLQRLRFERMDLPDLRVVAQAGGRLGVEAIGYFHEVMAERNGRFHVMYGQTEAGPRIACLPAGSLPERLGSVGLPMAGGRIRIVDASGASVPTGSVGEVEYEGPNVMMGYAHSDADLARGDDHGPVLRTGDLGYLDEDGYLFLTGRSKRIAKLAGARVSLDEVESLLPGVGVASGAVVSAGDDGIVVFAADLAPDQGDEVRRSLARSLSVAAAVISVRIVEEVPLLASGKVDYARMTEWGRQP